MPFKSQHVETSPKIDFDGACRLIESTLEGPARREIVAGVARAPDFSQSLTKLRDAMRAHVFPSSGRRIVLSDVVARFDALTGNDGFHVLHDWDGNRNQLNEETIPVDVVSFMSDQGSPRGSVSRVLGILLDYYFLYVLALMTLRIWDEGDANHNLDRLSRLLGTLQGPRGSGQRFASGAETLMLVAISHYEPDEKAYDRLLRRIQTLDRNHRETFALVLGGILGSHLRFGFEATYGRDIAALRNDNGPDYPWLMFALVTLVEAYDRGDGRDVVVEGLLNGLSPDPRAFVGRAPDALKTYQEEHARFRALFDEHRDALLAAFDEHRPSEDRYSPLAFYFNFLHNTLKAIVVDACLRGAPSRVGIDDLLTGFPESEAEAREAMARTLMAYARASPDRIRGQWVPVIVYDPKKGRRAFTETLRRLTR